MRTKTKTSKRRPKKELIDMANSYRGPIVAKSLIKEAGYGLFADKDYPKDVTITIYGGKLMDHETDGDYVLELEKDPPVFIDGASHFHPSEKGRWINHQPKDKCNVEYHIHTLKGIPICYVETIKPVKKGEEFHVNYGPFYW